MIIRENVPISELTTMRLGGEARFVVEITTAQDIPSALDFAKERELPIFVLGGGANTIGRDEGFPGVILLMKIDGIEVIDETSDEALVRGGAGVIWDDFVRFTAERRYSGIECLAKIPGTVGAAPVQNIGAYGQEVAQTIDNIEAYDTVSNEIVVLGRDELKMGYRTTLFNTGPEKGRYIITAVTFMLENDEPLEPPFYNSLQKYLDENNITDYSPMTLYDAVSAIRGDKLPDPNEKASSGSFFKNVYFPADDAETVAKAEEIGVKVYDKTDGRKMINTGALIEKAGLKGSLLHGMRVSDKAALVLINESAKSYKDLADARKEISDTVFEKFGFKIEQEPVEIV